MADKPVGRKVNKSLNIMINYQNHMRFQVFIRHGVGLFRYNGKHCKASLIQIFILSTLQFVQVLPIIKNDGRLLMTCLGLSVGHSRFSQKQNP
ncbi:Uncharacterized protein EbC_pEb17200980 (plasmid) [Erwinia billingiae Eb661]|uniref:Uncharacterized protein n=1 Tax=Erwinia billingiae (strain Eb661) TaxID=634500 RepID=D8MJV3_ERWBE|nr:Uncharacterized protein EbC_pEb17200980 [Erwinia billingiae Eb661]